MSFNVYLIRAVLYFFCFIVFSYDCESQTSSPETPYNVNIFPPSPNSASIAKFGEIPVGHYTGIPSVDVPLYEIKTGEFSFPISINYHAGGYKVGEMASNVGLGWSLQSAGVISRTVRGLADESIGGYLTNSVDISSVMALPEEDKLELYRQVNGELIDLQGDIYNFNFMGKSGRFRWDKLTNKGVLLNNNVNL